MTLEFNRELDRLSKQKDKEDSIRKDAEERRSAPIRAAAIKRKADAEKWEKDPDRRKKLSEISKEFEEILIGVKKHFLQDRGWIEGGDMNSYATYTEISLSWYSNSSGNKILLKIGTPLREVDGGIRVLMGSNTTLEYLESIDTDSISFVVGEGNRLLETDAKDSSWKTNVQKRIVEALQNDECDWTIPDTDYERTHVGDF